MTTWSAYFLVGIRELSSLSTQEYRGQSPTSDTAAGRRRQDFVWVERHPLTGAQQCRLVTLLASGIERYLRARGHLAPQVDLPAGVWLYDAHDDGDEAFGG